MGDGVPYPEHRLNWSLDSIPMFNFLCYPSVMIWSLPFPPSKIQPGSLLSRTSCPSPLSFRPNCLIFTRFCVFSRPPPASGHPSSVRWEATNPPDDGRPMSSPGFLSSVSYAGLHPPPTCAAGGTWLGCGWRGEGDGAPRDGLESLDASTGVAQVSVPLSTLEFPL